MRFATLCFMAALAAFLAGCEFGTLPGDGTTVTTESSLVDPVAGARPVETAPAADATRGAPSSPSIGAEGDDSGDEGFVTVSDCIEWTATGPRLVSCRVLRGMTDSVGHDDPDPWVPVSGLPKTAF